MTKHQLQTQVMEWLADLPEAEFDAAVIVAILPEDEKGEHWNHVGVTVDCTPEQYQTCVADLLDNGEKNGFLHGINMN